MLTGIDNQAAAESCLYRVSVKALILHENGTKFLIAKDDTGFWDLPGGGLEWNANPHEELRREVREEMGLELAWISNDPCYFDTGTQVLNKRRHIANVVFECQLESLNFVPTKECTDIRFVDKLIVTDVYSSDIVQKISRRFDSK